MPCTQGAPPTLLGLFRSVPSQQTAIIVREHDIRISYGRLRDRVEAFAEALAGAGIRPWRSAILELGEPLGVTMTAMRTLYACTKMRDEHRHRRLLPHPQEEAR
jgi:non-ribosomal peptide synthetase component E (peptide arylation enzyme)